MTPDEQPLQQPSRQPRAWRDRTWQEIPYDLGAAGDAAILPVGATEQHGPHLGCGMDFVLAHHLCRDVSARTGVPVLPTLAYGCSLGHSRRWPGTLTLDPEVMIRVVTQIGTSAYQSGVRRLFLINAHVTNAAPLRCALEILRATHDDLMVAHIDTATMSGRVRAEHFADADDWHANAAETSLMMAIAPHMVREDRLRDADDADRTKGNVFAHPVNRTSRNGVTGSPSRASSARGRALYDWMVEDLAAIVARGLTEVPPLPHAYAQRVDTAARKETST